jgi:hypothetical protein
MLTHLILYSLRVNDTGVLMVKALLQLHNAQIKTSPLVSSCCSEMGEVNNRPYHRHIYLLPKGLLVKRVTVTSQHLSKLCVRQIDLDTSKRYCKYQEQFSQTSNRLPSRPSMPILAFNCSNGIIGGLEESEAAVVAEESGTTAGAGVGGGLAGGGDCCCG